MRMPIPKIIHQTYKDHILPENYRMCQREMKKLHPDYEYRFYTDEDMFQFMQTHFPEYQDAFQRLPRKIMRIDMFRYFLMYKCGGIYADMDYLMFKPFDLLEYEVVIPCNRENSDGTPARLGNCIFASKPGNPFWKLLMDSLHTTDRANIDFSIDTNIDEYVLGTGPMFVYQMWKDNPQDIHVPRRDLFHPALNTSKKYIEKLKSRGSYGMHFCVGGWRNNAL
jgi:mannosyltransferase OCH1-like enzyme